MDIVSIQCEVELVDVYSDVPHRSQKRTLIIDQTIKHLLVRRGRPSGHRVYRKRESTVHFHGQ